MNTSRRILAASEAPAIAHQRKNGTHQCADASPAGQEVTGSRWPKHCAAPRITMHLDRYLRAGKFDHYACFSCAAVSEPKPISDTDTHGRERRCGCCGEESALPLAVAVKEGWLRVLDAEQRVLNDQVRR